MSEEKPVATGRAKDTEIAIIDERSIRDKIYIVRGVQVMLDFELAEIYGYETKNFNRQVKNNAARFEGDRWKSYRGAKISPRYKRRESRAADPAFHMLLLNKEYICL